MSPRVGRPSRALTDDRKSLISGSRESPLEIREATQLRELRRPHRPIALLGWPLDVRFLHEARLTRWAMSCGCGAGAAGTLGLAALSLSLIGWEIHQNGFGSIGLGHGIMALAAVIGGALVGKALGLGWANVQWRKAVAAAIRDAP